MSKEAIDKLRQFTSCDAADALIKLGEPHGGFLPGISMYSPERQAGGTVIVGEAYTVEYAFLDDERPKIEGHYIDTVPDGAVLYISSPDVPNAVYGGLMSTCAQARGAVGTVVNGRVRDLAEHRDLGFPVFAKDTGTTAPQELLKVVSINNPLPHPTGHRDTAQTVHPGDIIIADLNGVVRIPRGLLDEVVRLIPDQVEADERMARAIRGGMGFVEASRMFRGK